MKKIIAFLVILLSFTSVNAAKLNQIVYFGDSLTDNGNLYKLLLHFLPKSPPYFEGRFSNGPTWSETVSKHYYNKYNMESWNYALGGATAIFHMPTPKFVSPTTLEIEVDKYLLDSLFRDRSKSLFVIWIGDNDYMFDEDADPATATKKVVDKIEWAISTLAYYGGENFLVMNLADASRTPMVQNEGSPDKLHNLVVAHNQKLDAALKRVKRLNPDIKLSFFNVYELFNDFMDNPDKYNQKYNVNIKNTKEACWTGGYWLKNQLSEQSLTNDIQRTLRSSKSDLPADFDASAMSRFILSSPELAYSYKMSKAYESGNVPCANANEHMFWDSIHPTEVIHMLLSQVVIETLDDQIFN